MSRSSVRRTAARAARERRKGRPGAGPAAQAVDVAAHRPASERRPSAASGGRRPGRVSPVEHHHVAASASASRTAAGGTAGRSGSSTARPARPRRAVRRRRPSPSGGGRGRRAPARRHRPIRHAAEHATRQSTKSAAGPLEDASEPSIAAVCCRRTRRSSPASRTAPGSSGRRGRGAGRESVSPTKSLTCSSSSNSTGSAEADREAVEADDHGHRTSGCSASRGATTVRS